MGIIKKIFEIFFWLLGLAMCGIGLYFCVSEVIEDSTYVPCYVGVIFFISLIAFILFVFYIYSPLPIPRCKPKPKIFSTHLMFWFLIAAYVCGLGASLLWWGFTVVKHLHGLLLAFAIFVTILGGATLGGLFWQLIILLKNKFILKYGVETEATFIESCPMFSVHYGKEQGGSTVWQYYIKFKYIDGENEVVYKSHSIYSEAEAEYFKQKDKFLIKYKGKKAVISQLPEKDTQK